MLLKKKGGGLNGARFRSPEPISNAHALDHSSVDLEFVTALEQMVLVPEADAQSNTREVYPAASVRSAGGIYESTWLVGLELLIMASTSWSTSVDTILFGAT